MATRRYLKELLLASLMALGCAPSRQPQGPSRLQFEPTTDRKWTSPLLFAASPTQPEALLCCLGARAVSYGTTDMGQSWSTAHTSPSSPVQGRADEDNSVLLHTAQRAVLVHCQDDGWLRTAYTQDQGASWTPGGSTLVQQVPGVSPVGAMDAGNHTLAVVGNSDNMYYPLYLSGDEGDSWKTLQICLPPPQGYNKVSIRPPGVFDGPDLLVDSRERLHWLFAGYQLTTSDGKLKTGTFYLRSRDGVNMDQAQFTPGEFHSQSAALGENRSRPEVVYLVSVREEASKESQRISIPYGLEFSVSMDGGDHWSPPLLLNDHKGTKQFAQVQGDGDLVVISWQDDRSSQPGLYSASSVDGGKNWSKAEWAGETPSSRHYRLTVRGDSALLVGTVAGPSSFQPGPPFVLLGRRKS